MTSNPADTGAGRVLLLGATGYTGRLIARALARGTAPLVLCARSRERLAEVAAAGAETAIVDVTRPATLRSLLRPGDVVVNTVGPFTDLGDAVVSACIDGSAHYLDTTGEQRFMRWTEERHGEAAAAAGVAVVNGMAFEYALGDCAAALLAARATAPPHRIDVTYDWSGSASSRGTRRSVLRILGTRGWARVAGRLRLEPLGAKTRRVELPDRRARAVSFPAGEVLTVPRHVAVDTVRGWAVVPPWAAAGLRAIGPLVPPAVRWAQPLLERLVRRAGDPTEQDRLESRFTILVEARDAAGARRALAVSGRDPYGLTAEIIAAGAEAARRSPVRGVVAPAQLVRPQALFDRLRGHGVELVSVPA